MFDLLILPMHDWKKCQKEGFRTRDGHFMEHFCRSPKVGKILVVDRPVSLAESILRRRGGPIEGGRLVLRGRDFWLTEAVPDKCYVLDMSAGEILRPLLLGRDWWDHVFRKARVHAVIREAAEHLGLKGPVLFLWSPLSTGVLDSVPHRLLVFDALDNWLNHPIIRDKRGLIAAGYETVRQRADLIFTNAQSIVDMLSPAGKCVPRFIQNGVDVERFRSGDIPLPSDMRGIPRPILGYSGKIAKRFNVGLCEKLAARFPGHHFVICGQILEKRWIDRLLRFPNVHYLGDKHYSDLPGYVRHFDIGLIPHHVGKHEIEGDPIKMYEYLAAGLPVVTTRIMGVHAFQDHIWIAENEAGFIRHVETCLDLVNRGSRTEIAERMTRALPGSVSWANKADLVLDSIRQKLQG